MRKIDGLPAPFFDLAMGVIFVLMALFLISTFDPPKPKADTGQITPKAAYLIQLDWPNDSKDDIDLYVKSPNGDIVYFGNREKPAMFLDRDQLGSVNNTVVTPSGEQISIPDRREIVSIRVPIAGEWVINAHGYRVSDGRSVPVKLTVIKLNPYSVVTVVDAAIEYRAEVTLANIVIDDSGNVTQVHLVPQSFVGQ